jgi:nicotinamidase-related amidase
MTTLQIPPMPMPVAVSLKAATSALFISDMTDKIYKAQPECVEPLVRALAGLLARARAAGLPVIYSTHTASVSTFLSMIAPREGDLFVALMGQDRFYETELDSILRNRGIETLIITGWKISGSVLYTSVGATLRGYTVVVPMDTTSAATEFEIAIGAYQMLTQSSSNASNEPLKLRATTLSRSDLITFA